MTDYYLAGNTIPLSLDGDAANQQAPVLRGRKMTLKKVSRDVYERKLADAQGDVQSLEAEAEVLMASQQSERDKARQAALEKYPELAGLI